MVYILEEIKIFLTFFRGFIDLVLHFDLCENESYGTFVAKADFFTRKNLLNTLQTFNKLKCGSIYTLEQK